MGYIGNTSTTLLRQTAVYVATQGQTEFYIPGGYNLNSIDVYVNGIKLLLDTDYSASDGSRIIFTTGLTAGDEVEFVIYGDYQYTNLNHNQPTARTIFTYTATASQTTFTVPGGYVTGAVDVFLNGIKLISTTDYADTSQTDIVLTSGASLNDELQVIKYENFTIGNAVLKTGDTLQGTLTTQNLLPDVTLTRDIGSSTLRYNDLWLSSSTIHLGDRQLSATNVPNVNLTIAPEVLEIQVDDPTAGHGTAWLWTWLTSSLPYARTTITNQPQTIVPLYLQGTYVINNFAFTAHGDMTQGHDLKLKWVEGAGNDNLIEWVNYSTVQHSHPDINDGNLINVRRLSFQVPSTITPPTLNAPTVDYYIENSGFSSWYFTHDPNNMMVTGSNHGENPTLGPWYRGGTYNLHVDAAGHPLYLTTDNGSNFASGTYFGEYTDGVTNSRTSSGTLTITVPNDAPDTLYYQCGNHNSMRGSIRVQDLAVETNVNGNFIVYAQHSQEAHAQKIELRPIPALVNQMCLVYEESSGTFVPQDLATYVENTPSFKNKIQEVAGTAELVVEDGSAVIAKVNVYYGDATYLPLLGNNAGDQAFVTDTNVLYIWDGTSWQQAGSTNADDLVEGSNNLFYTDARVDARLASGSVGDVTISGNLQVNGTTTTINSTTLTVDDKNIVLANGSANAAASDGAGITADLGSDGSATLTYSSSNDRWEMNKSLAASVIGNVTGQVSDISNHSTTDLTEGTNLYYTDTRVDARIAASPGDNQKVFVATGAISAGEVVGLRNDGTVEVISYGPQIENVGTPEHLSAFTSWTAATFDSSQNKVVIFYRNPLGNLYHGTAVVGTVDGTNITFGTPVVFNSANTLNIHSAFDSNTNKVVIAYRDGGNSSHGTAIVGTISGTSISFGTPVVFESSTTYVADMTFDSNSNKVVIVWSGKTIVGTVSGTSISFGTSVTYSSGGSDEAITFDSNSNQVVIGYEDSTSGYGTAVVGTVSGTSITFGTPAVYESGGINYNSATFDSNLNKVVFAYRDSSNTGSAVVGTVSGTSISFGTPVVFNNGYTIWNAPVFDPYTNQGIIAYTDLSNSSYGTLIVGTVSGTSISFGSEVIFNTANSTYIRSVFDTSQNKVVITYQDAGNNNYIAGIVYTPPGTFSETNANSWIGIAAENIADTATGIIDLPGAVNRSQTGLTTNSIYYVDSDGSVTTTPTIYGKIGRAYSATELQIFESYKQLNFASHLIFGN